MERNRIEKLYKQAQEKEKKDKLELGRLEAQRQLDELEEAERKIAQIEDE